MNEYRIKSTGQIITEDEFRLRYPNSSLPAVFNSEFLQSFGLDVILASPVPPTTLYQDVKRDGIEQDSKGNWIQRWSIIDWSDTQVQSAVDDAKTSKWEAIKKERERRMLYGGVKVEQKWFSTDLIARTQYLRLNCIADELLLANQPRDTILQVNGKNISWKTMDNTFIDLTIDLIKKILSQLDDQEAAIFEAAELHLATLNSSLHPAQYNFLTGWPISYGDS